MFWGLPPEGNGSLQKSRELLEGGLGLGALRLAGSKGGPLKFKP